MIPLGRWLIERDAPVAETVIGQVPVPDPGPAGEPDLPVRGDVATEREGRITFLEETLRQTEAKAEEERLRHASHVASLREEFGAELANRLSAEITDAFARLQSSLEASLTSVLQPFLAEATRRQAVSALTELVRQHVESTDAPILEIRAPEDLLPAVGKAVPASRQTPWHRVEVLHEGHVQRFEELSSRWIAILEGHAP